MNDEEEMKKTLTQWCESVLHEMMNRESESRTHAERTKLGIGRSQKENVRSLTLGVLKMKCKLNKHPHDDIRRFFNG